MGGGCCVGDNPVVNFFRDIFCSDTGCGYHPSSSKTDDHAKKIADELAQMKTKMGKYTKEREKEIIDYINKSMDELLDELERINHQKYGGKSLNINISGIRQKKEELKKEVVGCIEIELSNRLVLTDPELSVILKEVNDDKRKKNFDSFVEKVQQKSLSKLKDKVQTTVDKQQQMIKSEVNIRMKEVQQNMDTATNSYNKLLQQKKSDETKLEAERIGLIYHYEITQIILDELRE